MATLPQTTQEMFFEHIGFDLSDQVDLGPGGVYLNGLFTMKDLQRIARGYITYIEYQQPMPSVEQLRFAFQR